MGEVADVMMNIEGAFVVGILLGMALGYSSWSLWAAGEVRKARWKWLDAQLRLAEKLREMMDKPTPGCSCIRCTEILVNRSARN